MIAIDSLVLSLSSLDEILCDYECDLIWGGLLELYKESYRV